jgi:hypothetical protein
MQSIKLFIQKFPCAFTYVYINITMGFICLHIQNILYNTIREKQTEFHVLLKREGLEFGELFGDECGELHKKVFVQER